MSAYIVDEGHIDALVTAAMELTDPGWQMRWIELAPPEPTDYERGQVSGSTAVASFEARVRRMVPENASHVGRMLLFENMRSVAHRYDEALELPDYDYQRLARRLTPVEVLLAISGYEYQACEHPGWEGSEAHAFCAALTKEAIRKLPGCGEADTWEVTR